MGTNINYEELLEERNRAVERILNNFRNWDKELESGLQIIKDNQVEMDRIDTLNLQLSRYPEAQRVEYIEKIKEIIEEQKKLQTLIKEKQDSLLKSMQQLNKKDMVIKNYISKSKKSLFIDKDVR
jgi:hypothetical protein